MAKTGRKQKIGSEQADTAPQDSYELQLYKQQREFFECDKFLKTFLGGVGSGKSTVGAADIILHSEPGDFVAVIAPTFRQLMLSTFRSFKEMAQKFGLWDESQYKVTASTEKLKNNVEVVFASADEPDNFRGPSIRRIWLDEAGLMKEKMFDVAIGRLRQHGKRGFLSATFTPQSKEHWTYKVLYDKENPNLGIFHATTLNNPFLDSEFYEALKKQYPMGEQGQLRMLRELEGQWVNMSGSEWGPTYFGETMWFNNWPNARTNDRIATLDTSKGIGGKLGDYSAFILMQSYDNALWVEADMDNARNTTQIVDRMLDIQRSFRPQAFGIEEAFGGGILADAMDRAIQNLPPSFKLAFNPVLIPTGGFRKEHRIHRLGPFITNGLFRFRKTPGTRILVNQLENWPGVDHDDGPDALEMCTRLGNEVGWFDGYDEQENPASKAMPSDAELAAALN